MRRSQLFKRRSSYLLLLVFLVLVAGVVVVARDNGSAGRKVVRRSYLVVIHRNDVKAMEGWTRLTCRRNSVGDLASQWGIKARLNTVIARMARGLPSRTRAAVERVCKAEELLKTAAKQRSEHWWGG